MAALFGKKKKEEEKVDETTQAKDTPKEKTPKVAKEVVTKSEVTPVVVVDGRENLARVLSHPRITEKASMGIERGVYVFDVAPDSNKKQIKEAIKLVYDVDPIKVHVSKIAKKNVRNMRTGAKGVKGGGKKAYVYLKKGDTISIM